MSRDAIIKEESDGTSTRATVLQTESPHSLRQPSRMSDKSTNIISRNRRKVYMDSHPEYFSSDYLELAEPLLYDRLIRRFQTASEREADGRKKGYSGILEADLIRSEAKIQAVSEARSKTIIEEEEEPQSKEEAFERWRKFIEIRFLRGEDIDFDYRTVDENDELDSQSQDLKRDEEDKYFDGEEPRWIKSVEEDESDSSITLTGETGVQDF